MAKIFEPVKPKLNDSPEKFVEYAKQKGAYDTAVARAKTTLKAKKDILSGNLSATKNLGVKAASKTGSKRKSVNI